MSETAAPRARSANTRERVTTLAYRAGWVVIRLLPERLAYAAFQVAADVLWRGRATPVRRYEDNVRPLLALGDEVLDDEELRRLGRAGMRSYLRYWCEVFRLEATDRATLVARVRTIGEHHLRDPLRAGRGVVCALPHMANWDHAGAWAVSTEISMSTVAERLEPAAVFDAFVAYRESLGMEVLAVDDPAVFGRLADRLRGGRMVALVADRDLSARGVEVRFGPGRTRMPAGPAALALRTGVSLVPVTLWYDGPNLCLRFHDPVTRPPDLHGAAAVAAMTQQVADVFAIAISEHPQDWHMLQRFWLDGPDGAVTARHNEPPNFERRDGRPAEPRDAGRQPGSDAQIARR